MTGKEPQQSYWTLDGLNGAPDWQNLQKLLLNIVRTNRSMLIMTSKGQKRLFNCVYIKGCFQQKQELYDSHPRLMVIIWYYTLILGITFFLEEKQIILIHCDSLGLEYALSKLNAHTIISSLLLYVLRVCDHVSIHFCSK